MKILVTNDDGDSEGLRQLLEAAGSLGDAYAVIPNRQRSAVSGAITLHKPLRLHKVGAGGDRIHTLTGTPCDCVLFGIYSGEVPKPDIVLSGVNWGDNTGMAPMVGSGTLGACWQAALEGVPSIAFSLYRKGREGWREKDRWGAHDKMVALLSRIIRALEPELRTDRFFSVNLPEDPIRAGAIGDGDVDEGIIRTNRLQKMRFTAQITKRLDPDGAPYYWISSAKTEPEPGSDYEEVKVKGKIVVTEIDLGMLMGD